VFSQPKVEDQFKKFVTVRLHADRVPAGVDQVPDAAGAAAFRNEKFKNYALPYYVIIRPRGKTLERLWYSKQSLIENPDEFAKKLEKVLAAAK
jgi:hypothetical protein